ncbi:glucose-6-phosphate isomerase [Streptococcus suis]|nr:glucose-6-phosphate isomerase [Streptococcus suis]
MEEKERSSMKKTILALGLTSLLLAACGSTDKASDATTSSSSEALSTTLPILEEKKDTTNETFDVLANAEYQVVNENPPADETQKVHKLLSANNWVAEKDENGEIIYHYRYYDVPASWTISQENTEDETLAAVYDVKDGQNQFIIQLYTLNAFQASPLDGGTIMTDDQWAARMTETNHTFTETGTVTIQGQEWKVGRQILADKKMGRITFYRLENTGGYDDSVVVGTVVYPLEAVYDSDRAVLKKTIGQLKDVLYQVSKK